MRMPIMNDCACYNSCRRIQVEVARLFIAIIIAGNRLLVPYCSLQRSLVRISHIIKFIGCYEKVD